MKGVLNAFWFREHIKCSSKNVLVSELSGEGVFDKNNFFFTSALGRDHKGCNHLISGVC